MKFKFVITLLFAFPLQSAFCRPYVMNSTNQVKITWEDFKDLPNVCAGITGSKKGGELIKKDYCVFWDKDYDGGDMCLVFTHKNPSERIIGSALKHCFTKR